MKTWLLLDGFNLVFRAFYAIRELSRSDGFPTNAIHGWLRTYLRLVEEQKPDRVMAFFDKGGSTMRKELHPLYKANRAATPELLVPQLPIIKKLTEQLGINVIEQEGIEADDLIGAAAQKIRAAGDRAIIVSADKDLAQCLNESVSQLLPPPTANPRIGWRPLHPEGVTEKFGVRTDQIVDYLSLIGDSSDNIPGVPGVGPKTASKWIADYDTLETLLQKAPYLTPKRFQNVLPEHKEQLIKNQKLITLQPIENFELPAPEPADVQALLEELQSLEMTKNHADFERFFSSTQAS